MLENTNFIAIIIATIVSMGIGAGWYWMLGDKWKKAVGLSNEQIEKFVKQGPGMQTMSITVLCHFIMAFMLSGVIYHTGGFDPFNICNGIIAAVLVWVGFIVPSMLINHRFQLKPIMLTAIDGGHYLITLSVQGIIIGWFGV